VLASRMSDNVPPAVTNRIIRRQLEALRSTLSDDEVIQFNRAVALMADISQFFSEITLTTWGYYFPPKSVDPTDVSSRVFVIASGLLPEARSTPSCPKCRSDTVFKVNRNVPFGWEYSCIRRRKMSRSEARRRKSTTRWICTGVVQATANTWLANSKSLRACTGLLFCWLNRMPVSHAAETVRCGKQSAVDHYSMIREVCEVVMSNEIVNMKLGGVGREVEVDECFLSRRKYHRGRRMRGETITLLGIYERATNLGFHV